MKQPDAKERLKIIVNSNTPLAVMETVEEVRAMAVIQAAAAEIGIPVFQWSIADGLSRCDAAAQAQPSRPAASAATAARGSQTMVERTLSSVSAAMGHANLPPVSAPHPPAAADQTGTAIYNTREAAQVLVHLEMSSIDAVYVLKDMHRHLDDAVVVRRLRDVAQQFAQDRRTVVLTAPALPLPAELQNQAEYVDLGLPDRARIQQIVEDQFARLGKRYTLRHTLDAPGMQAMAANLGGLTEEEVERAASQAIVMRAGLTPEVVTDVLEAKREMLRRSGMMEFIPTAENMSTVGGLENLKKWLHKRAGAFDDAARQFGLASPKGVIIMGVQGCGKSMSARAIAGEWKLPLVKFDASAIFDKFIGETEKHVQRMFKVAEQLAPCVLWIDELEKVFAGSGPDSSSSDAGTSSRLLGAFLSWMQEKTAPVFVAATSNNVNVLPPELIRKGRFDELFFVDLPNRTERAAIFNVQLTRRKQQPATFDLQKLVAASSGYSGAEIEAAVQSAMYAAYSDKQPMSTEGIVAELKETVPLSATRAEDLAALRVWAHTRAVAASIADAE